MRSWRIARRPFRALDGEGARQNGGRWNSEGVPVVYTSSTLALAALEYLVHIDIGDVPDDLIAIGIDVPDDAPVADVGVSDLPPDWKTIEDHPACIRHGDNWASATEALLLRVPSAIVPEEQNLLINPKHPDMPRVRVISTRDFAFDPRLL